MLSYLNTFVYFYKFKVLMYQILFGFFVLLIIFDLSICGYLFFTLHLVVKKRKFAVANNFGFVFNLTFYGTIHMHVSGLIWTFVLAYI